MDLERLKMWEAALVEADEKGRVFDFSAWQRHANDSPCGFTACLAGDLAMYGPAQDLGMKIEPTGRYGEITFGRAINDAAIVRFLGATTAETDWVVETILPYYATSAYRVPSHLVTRAAGLARIRAKIAEIEAKQRSETA
jgi:hypothetical protein